MHKRPSASFAGPLSTWVVELGLIMRSDWRPSDKKVPLVHRMRLSIHPEEEVVTFQSSTALYADTLTD